jgi:hypothetical protein
MDGFTAAGAGWGMRRNSMRIKANSVNFRYAKLVAMVLDLLSRNEVSVSPP